MGKFVVSYGNCFGAGEGNRTLVFSLEVEKFDNSRNSRSDILQPSGWLRSLRNFPLSEWRQPPARDSRGGSTSNPTPPRLSRCPLLKISLPPPTLPPHHRT